MKNFPGTHNKLSFKFQCLTMSNFKYLCRPGTHTFENLNFKWHSRRLDKFTEMRDISE